MVQKQWKTVRDFIFLGSKITADGDCSHEIKRCLLLGRKTMTNLGSILKSRDITLSTRARLVKAMVFHRVGDREAWRVAVHGVAKSRTRLSDWTELMVFPVVMYGCESWIIKKAESQKTDLLNCGVGEDSWESLDCKEIKPVNPKGN